MAIDLVCRSRSSLQWGIALAFVVLVLTGCAAQQAYQDGGRLMAEGRPEDGLAKLEEAVKLDPKKAEYRVALATGKAASINRLLSLADSARREDRWDDGVAFYNRVLKIDPQNSMAIQGLRATTQEQRTRIVLDEANKMYQERGIQSADEVLDRIKHVIAANPASRSAIALKEKIEQEKLTASRDRRGLSPVFRKTVTLQFRDAPLRSVMDLISQTSGLNILLDSDVRPDLRITISVANGTVEDVLRFIVATNQLKQRILGENAVLLYPATPQKIKEHQAMLVRSFYLANADVKTVSSAIKTIVKTQDIVVDERLGIIIMRDSPGAIKLAERIVAIHDLSDPEAMLEVEILEVKRSRLLELGIQWPSQLALSPVQSTGVPLTLEALRNISSSTTQAAIGSININARKEDQDANILANPRIRVRNKEKAKVLIGDRVPVITTTSTSTGFVAESVSYLDVGLKLEVEPNIYLDEDVAIKINLEVSSLVKEVLSKSGSLSYQIGTRGASTLLQLKNGETQILAGLISDEERSTANKVPGLGDLPVLGRLFGSQKDDTQRTEILLSITPRVVRSIPRPSLFSTEFDSGTDSHIGETLPQSVTPTIFPSLPTRP